MSKRQREEDGGPGGEAGDGGEIALSIEETNKLRISLGLKPLTMGAPKADDVARRNADDARKKKDQEARAKEFVAKQAEKKARAAQDDFLNVKGLGEDDSVDDMETWLERSKVAEVAKRAEERARKRQEAEDAERKRRAAEEGEDDEDEGGGKYTAADLAGLKVRSGVDDLGEGETMVLTLADRRMLDARGRDYAEDAEDDELENVLKAEQRKREKARDAAAPKAKPLWEEDGKRRGMLDKYDEQEADLVLQIGADGGLDAERKRRADEVKQKLAEAGKVLESAAVGALAPGANGAAGAPAFGTAAADFLTQEEVAAKAAFKKKRKEKKERKMRTKEADPEDGSTAGLVEALEAEADARAAAGDAPAAARSELGSRAERLAARERAEAALRSDAQEKRRRFEAAVEKGNWASQALKPLVAAPAEVVVGDDDEDRELRESLERARRMAQAQAQARAVKSEGGVKEEGGEEDSKAPAAGVGSSLEEIARGAGARREREEAELRAALAGGKDSLLVNDTMEFVRNITVKAEAAPMPAPSAALGAASVAGGGRVPPPPPPPPPPKDGDDDDYMDLGGEGGGEAEAGPSKGGVRGGWVQAAADGEEDGEGGPAGGRRAGRQMRRKGAGSEGGEDEDEEMGEAGGSGQGPGEGGIEERSVGRGLAAALAAARERGQLVAESHIKWAGRTNDRSKVALQGLVGDVYTGGSHDDRLARSIETALTAKDEFGRVLTPKERFRQLNYDFHGIRPSKNKEDKRLRLAKEEIARQKNATSEVVGQHEMEGLRKATETAAQPYVVLQGKGAAEQLKVMEAVVAASKASAKAHGKPPKPPGKK